MRKRNGTPLNIVRNLTVNITPAGGLAGDDVPFKQGEREKNSACIFLILFLPLEDSQHSTFVLSNIRKRSARWKKSV